MGKFVLLDARLFTGGADLSGASNKIEIKAETEEKDATSYRSQGWKELLGGLKSAEVSAGGQWEAGDPGMIDDVAWLQLGGRGAWTVAPTEATVGAVAYVSRFLQSDYALGDAVGEVAPWTATGKSTWPLARGLIAHAPGTPRTAAGEGQAVELGQIAARQRLYAALNVLSVAGSTPTLTVTVESAADEEFTDPAEVLAFAPATTRGGQLIRSTGDAITDAWYRVTWDVTGADPSFMFVVALGIA